MAASGPAHSRDGELGRRRPQLQLHISALVELRGPGRWGWGWGGGGDREAAQRGGRGEGRLAKTNPPVTVVAFCCSTVQPWSRAGGALPAAG